jgi:acetyl esterase
LPLGEQARDLIRLLDQRFPAVEVLDSVPAARAASKSAPPPLEVETVGAVENRRIPAGDHEIPIRIFHPRDTHMPAPGLVYLHGGGWVLCDLDTHDGACRRLANETGSVVVSVDYRLAPEHPFPAGLDDAYSATVWTCANADALGIDRGRVGVAGDSSGGNLAAAVTLLAREHESCALAFQFLVYPVIDSSSRRNDYPSKHENATGFRLTTASMDWYRSHYLRDDGDGEDPLVSPIRARDLHGLPPACIVTAELDPLRDEGEAYAAALAAAGVATTTYRAEGMFHGFFNMDALLPEALDAQQIAFARVRAGLGGSS